MRSDADAKRQIIEIANDLFAAGHLTPTGGNISARAADDDKIWITPSQLYKGSLTADTLLCIREDGSLVECEGKPSVEFQMHWKSYQVRPDATAAVHTHSPAATAFGITNQKFPPINTDAIFLADTQIVPGSCPGRASSPTRCPRRSRSAAARSCNAMGSWRSGRPCVTPRRAR
jgi:ribulose-5-phosphate 4-epimerase/fuculose-1-phosphate aldolase